MQWLQDCFSKHQYCPRPTSGTLPTGFRLINTQRRCLVQAGPNCQYGALSYILGDHPDPTKLRLKKSNIEILQADGGLAESDVPTTFNDAIEVCRRLNIDYLWADGLCTVQDDDEDKKEQARSKGTIFFHAHVVIIATDGDIDSGIPGVSRDRCQAQVREQISGIGFMNDVTHWRDITGGSSVWSTLRSTYQEAVLGRRKLVLTDAQAFFECGQSVIGEDESSQMAMYSPNALNPQPWKPLVKTFFDHVGRYRRRSRSDLSDMYDGIDGIATALYGEPGSLLYGLPRRDFDRSLLWCTDLGDDLRSAGSLDDWTRPSWSWASTPKSFTLLDNCNRRSLFYCDTLIAWASYVNAGPTGRLESVETSLGKPLSQFQVQDTCGCSKNPDKRSEEKLLYLAIAWIQGCINKPCPFGPLEEITLETLKKQVATRWPCHHAYWQDTLRATFNVRDENTLPSWAMEQPIQTGGGMKPSAIISLAHSAYFRLRGSVHTNKHLVDLCIIDENGRPVGILVTPDLELKLDLAPELSAGPGLEFIALSISTVSKTALYDEDASLYVQKVSLQGISGNYVGLVADFNCRRDGDSTNSVTFSDKDGTPLLASPAVNVMLVRRSGTMARRLCVGWIYLTAWVNARPKFQVVVLQ